MQSAIAPEFEEVAVGGIPFAVAEPAAVQRWLRDEALARARGVSVRLTNAYCVALASENEAYNSVMSSGINFADGTPIGWLLRRRSTTSQRTWTVRGPTLFRAFIEQNDDIPGFFIGSTEDVLSRIHERLDSAGNGGSWAGGYSPPFGPVTDELVETLVDQVRRSACRVVWVGMGTPKQDILTTLLAKEVNLPFVGVGAAFDFYAGTVSEAPAFIQGSGLEWLYRLAKEPRRLVNRYTTGNYKFLRAIAKNYPEKRRGS